MNNDITVYGVIKYPYDVFKPIEEYVKTLNQAYKGSQNMVHAYLTHKISVEGDLGKVDILKKLIDNAKKAEKAAAKAEKKTAKTARKTK